MVFPRFGNPRRILRVLPQASRFLANLWLPAPRRSTQENLLQKCAEARPRHRPKGLPGLGFRLQLLLFFLRRISRLYKEPSNAPLTPSSQSALIKVLFLGAGAVAIPAVVRGTCNAFDCDWIVGNWDLNFCLARDTERDAISAGSLEPNAGLGNASSICSTPRASSLLDAVGPALLHLYDSQEVSSRPKRRQMVIRFRVCWNGTKVGVCRLRLPILSE